MLPMGIPIMRINGANGFMSSFNGFFIIIFLSLITLTWVLARITSNMKAIKPHRLAFPFRSHYMGSSVLLAFAGFNSPNVTII